MLLGSDDMLGLLILFVENLNVQEITAIAVVTILLLVMADRTFTENVVVERSEINKVLNYYTTAFLITISTVEVTQEGTLAYTPLAECQWVIPATLKRTTWYSEETKR